MKALIGLFILSVGCATTTRYDSTKYKDAKSLVTGYRLISVSHSAASVAPASKTYNGEQYYVSADRGKVMTIKYLGKGNGLAILTGFSEELSHCNGQYECRDAGIFNPDKSAGLIYVRIPVIGEIPTFAITGRNNKKPVHVKISEVNMCGRQAEPIMLHTTMRGATPIVSLDGEEFVGDLESRFCLYQAGAGKPLSVYDNRYILPGAATEYAIAEAKHGVPSGLTFEQAQAACSELNKIEYAKTNMTTDKWHLPYATTKQRPSTNQVDSWSELVMLRNQLGSGSWDSPSYGFGWFWSATSVSSSDSRGWAVKLASSSIHQMDKNVYNGVICVRNFK